MQYIILYTRISMFIGEKWPWGVHKSPQKEKEKDKN